MKKPRLVRTLFLTLLVIDLCLLLLLCARPVHARWLAHPAGKPSPDPELFAPGVISTPEDETAATLSPDGRTLLFSRAGAIWESRLESGQWSTPQIAGFSGHQKDYYPSFAPDGSKVFFTSSDPNRAGDGATAPLGIWVAKRTRNGWGDREELPPAVNLEDREGAVYCSSSADGTLFFGLGKPGVRHIMFSKLVGGEYGPSQSVGSRINTKAFQGYHAISPDGRFLIFTSNRSGGLGGMDLYVSLIENGEWTEPRNLGAPVNTSADDSHASISADGRSLFFASNRTSLDAPQTTRLYSKMKETLDGILGGNRNIYRVEIDALNLDAR